MQATQAVTVIPRAQIARSNPYDLCPFGFMLTPSGLQPIGAPTYEQWYECGERLHELVKILESRTRMVQFAIGDWLNYGESRWSDKYSQALDATKYDLETLHNFSYVSKHVSPSLRRDDLSYSHHVMVARVESRDEQNAWLGAAEAGKWTVREMRQHMDENPSTAPKVKTAVALLPGEWSSRADYLNATQDTDEARSKAETYRQCAKELLDALAKDKIR